MVGDFPPKSTWILQMFGMFKSDSDRAIDAVVAFVRDQLSRSRPLPAAVLADRYCIGFLQMVSVHVASQHLPKGSGMDGAKAIFVKAMERLAPSRAGEIAETLPFLKNDETFLRGTKDGDLYMGWKLLKLAPERDGQAAFARFNGRIEEVSSHAKAKPPSNEAPHNGASSREARGSISFTDWEAGDKSEGFDGPAKQEISRTYTFSHPKAPSATLTIVCALEVEIMPDGETASLDRKLRFHLRPFRLPHEADFIMRLVTRDESQGGEFDIVAEPREPGSEWSTIAKYGGRNDVATCVNTFRSGRDMLFRLRDERELLVDFLLPKDGSFQRLYDETLQRLQQRAVLNQTLRYNARLQRDRRTDKSGAPQRIKGSDWFVTGSGHEFTLSRKYSSRGETIEIICDVRSSKEVNHVVSDLRVRFSAFHFHQHKSLVLGLFTDEPKGALVEVEVIGPDRSGASDIMMLVHREDAHKILRAIASGDDLHFAMITPAPPDEEPFLNDPLDSLAKYVLANDGQFKVAYEEAIEKVSICQDATRARQLRENWYRRRTPGENSGL